MAEAIIKLVVGRRMRERRIKREDCMREDVEKWNWPRRMQRTDRFREKESEPQTAISYLKNKEEVAVFVVKTRWASSAIPPK